VLGVLTQGEHSGYDLLKRIEGGVGFFWTPAKSQLYALLPKLVERGRRALREGLEQPSPAVDRNAFELRLFFGEHMRPGAVRKLIEARRDSQAAHLAVLEEIERDLDPTEQLYEYLTLLAGKENTQAAIRWAEQALELLDRK
jgi:hypothetical protein